MESNPEKRGLNTNQVLASSAIASPDLMIGVGLPLKSFKVIFL